AMKLPGIREAFELRTHWHPDAQLVLVRPHLLAGHATEHNEWRAVEQCLDVIPAKPLRHDTAPADGRRLYRHGAGMTEQCGSFSSMSRAMVMRPPGLFSFGAGWIRWPRAGRP